MRGQMVPLLFQVSAAMLPPLMHVLTNTRERDQLPMSGLPLFEALRGGLGLGISHREKIVTVNDWWLTRLGYQLDEVAGHEISEFVAGTRSEEPVTYADVAIPHRHKDGHIVSFRVHIYPLITDGSDRITVFETV